MSPKQFWQEYGATILGDLDVKRDAKSKLVEEEGKALNQSKVDAFSQSWGKFEKFKGFIVRGAQLLYKPAGVTREVVTERLAPLFGKELVFSDGTTARFPKASLQKMLSGKAVAKSTNAEIHNFVLSNIQVVAQKAIKGWTKEDRSGNWSIAGVHRYVSAIENDGSTYLAKITAKTYKDSNEPNKAYSIESVEVKTLDEAKGWLEEYSRADMKEKPATAETSLAGGGAEKAVKLPSARLQYTELSPSLQDLTEALFKFKDGSFSQRLLP